MDEYKIAKEIHKDPFIYSLGMCLFLFSTILGHSILINILGRTPKLFWVEVSEVVIFYISIIYKGFKIIRSKFLNKQTRYIVAGIESALVVGFINSFLEPLLFYESYRALFWFCFGTINIIYYLNYSKKVEIKK